MRGEFGSTAPRKGDLPCTHSQGRRSVDRQQMRRNSSSGRADSPRGQREAAWLLAQGERVPQEPRLAVGGHPTSMASFLSKMPLPFYSFFGRLALELPCLSLLELGRPLAWCSGTSWSISSVEVGGCVLTHHWAVVCGRHKTLSNPSLCKITARTVLIIFRYW